MSININKRELHGICLELIKERILAMKSKLASIEESRNNETKSSAGDKYETGRAMMQMEEEKTRMQLQKANQLRLELTTIDLDQAFDQVQKGSLVITEKAKYYISIGLGKVKVGDEMYYCISTSSPIGKLMYGKVVGDQIEFAGRSIQINEII